MGFGGFATLEYLGDFAFKGCQNMTSIIINSSNIQYFGPGALSHMPKLTTISGNDIGPNYIVGHNAVFYREDGDLATKIVATCSGSTISSFAAEQIKEICPYAFAGIDLGQNLSNVLDLSSLNSLTTIGKYAFADLVGSSSGKPHDIAIRLPLSVTTIGDYAFAGSNVANTSFIFSLHFLTN
ncbi:MAG: leucine-rich repeat domain-containing protein [Mycoplasmoidaceae bacterium]|nr:leucine-rich repeat domain-containing protein [Mycoplasmoidaceae bacterium]